MAGQKSEFAKIQPLPEKVSCALRYAPNVAYFLDRISPYEMEQPVVMYIPGNGHYVEEIGLVFLGKLGTCR